MSVPIGGNSVSTLKLLDPTGVPFPSSSKIVLGTLNFADGGDLGPAVTVNFTGDAAFDGGNFNVIFGQPAFNAVHLGGPDFIFADFVVLVIGGNQLTVHANVSALGAGATMNFIAFQA